jgi:23S rRNA A2030 N6-methylase RlmJ
VNPRAANPGDVVKHLVLAELLHLERRRITTYVDTHAGRPWNDLTQPGYAFSQPARQPRAAWADRFMERATRGELGSEIRKARYTRILQEDHGGGVFWGSRGLSAKPVYPGSVGIALASAIDLKAWLCGECDRGDQRRLRAVLPPGSVFRSVLSGRGRSRVEASLGRGAFVLVDPNNLNDPKSADAAAAREFACHAASEGAIVEAWYPLYTTQTPRNLREICRRVRRGLKIEVWWSPGSGPPLKGAGIIVANVGERAAARLTALANALRHLSWRVTVSQL